MFAKHLEFFRISEHLEFFFAFSDFEFEQMIEKSMQCAQKYDPRLLDKVETGTEHSQVTVIYCNTLVFRAT